MERGLVMLLHSIIIGLILFVLMRFALGQSLAVAEDRSVLIGAVVLIYMVLFGHRLPGSMNRNIM
jgi:TRAP-type C4-dicarboxylate transport system permease small subunit